VAAEAPDATTSGLPGGLVGLLTNLATTTRGVGVHRISEGRYIAYLPGPDGGRAARLRLADGDLSSYSTRVRDALTRAVTDTDARVMLVGSGPRAAADARRWWARSLTRSRMASAARPRHGIASLRATSRSAAARMSAPCSRSCPARLRITRVSPYITLLRGGSVPTR